MDNKTEIFKLTNKEKEMVDLIKKLDNGEIIIYVQNNVPVRVEEVKKKIIL